MQQNKWCLSNTGIDSNIVDEIYTLVTPAGTAAAERAEADAFVAQFLELGKD